MIFWRYYSAVRSRPDWADPEQSWLVHHPFPHPQSPGPLLSCVAPLKWRIVWRWPTIIGETRWLKHSGYCDIDWLTILYGIQWPVTVTCDWLLLSADDLIIDRYLFIRHWYSLTTAVTLTNIMTLIFIDWYSKLWWLKWHWKWRIGDTIWSDIVMPAPIAKPLGD